MKDRLVYLVQMAVCVGIGAVLVWAHLGDALEQCQTEREQVVAGHQLVTTSLAAQLQDVTERHYYADQSIKQWAAKLAKEEQAKKDAYAELGVALAAAHKWTDDEGRSVLDLPPLTRWQVAERAVVGMFTGVLAKVGK